MKPFLCLYVTHNEHGHIEPVPFMIGADDIDDAVNAGTSFLYYVDRMGHASTNNEYHTAREQLNDIRSRVKVFLEKEEVAAVMDDIRRVSPQIVDDLDAHLGEFLTMPVDTVSGFTEEQIVRLSTSITSHMISVRLENY